MRRRGAPLKIDCFLASNSKLAHALDCDFTLSVIMYIYFPFFVVGYNVNRIVLFLFVV